MNYFPCNVCERRGEYMYVYMYKAGVEMIFVSILYYITYTVLNYFP